MTLQNVLAPFDGVYTSLFTPKQVLEKTGKNNWELTCSAISTKFRDAFFKKLLVDLSSETDEGIRNPQDLCRRINEALYPSFKPPVKKDRSCILFNSKDPEWGFLSNFYPTAVCVDRRFCSSAEHAYQRIIAEQIDPLSHLRNTELWCDPLKAKHFGATAEKTWELYATPEQKIELKNEKLGVMTKVIACKFDQNKAFADNLVATYPNLLVENTEDPLWGGRNGNNTLGFILEAKRSSLLRNPL